MQREISWELRRIRQIASKEKKKIEAKEQVQIFIGEGATDSFNLQPDKNTYT